MTLYCRMNSFDKMDLLRRCREKESDGWECAKPIQREQKELTTADFTPFSERSKRCHFGEWSDSLKWTVLYKKEAGE